MRTRASADRRLPKVCGADIELGNFILGLDSSRGTGPIASRLLLREIPGYLAWCPEMTKGQSSGYHRQDWGRRFLASNGGCAYIDLDHLELCIPEVISAYDHVAAWHAMLRVGRTALRSANARLPAGRRLLVLVNNSDGFGNSYGSHLNFLVHRQTWEDLFHRRMQTVLYLAACQVSAIILTGQGKVGSENGAPAVAYQISQRADFCERLVDVQTTFARPIVNSRDEPLSGSAWHRPLADDPTAAYGRLHVIFFDNALCQVACLLRVGMMQILLCLLEAGRVDDRVLLDDPLAALRAWSHDPNLKARAVTSTGQRVTAVEHQLLVLERVSKFVGDGGCDPFVPRAGEILALWQETVQKLAARDFPALRSRLDWVLKKSLLDRARRRKPDLGWGSPQLKHLDQIYSSLDPREGLFGKVAPASTEQIVSEAEIARFVNEPPPATRAWTRAMLLRRAGPCVQSVGWDAIRFRRGDFLRDGTRTLAMPDPLRFTARETAPILAREAGLTGLLDALEAGAGQPPESACPGANQ